LLRNAFGFDAIYALPDQSHSGIVATYSQHFSIDGFSISALFAAKRSDLGVRSRFFDCSKSGTCRVSFLFGLGIVWSHLLHNFPMIFTSSSSVLLWRRLPFCSARLPGRTALCAAGLTLAATALTAFLRPNRAALSVRHHLHH
jgi:hypothetical protein